MRGSSVHFKRISSAMHAVSHASRDAPPEYLLPEGMSLGTHVVIDDHGQVEKLLQHKMHLASRQAKATKDYSPMWEGVINLPDPADATPQQQIEIVKAWCVEYEKMTGHKVIRADVHLDEGYIDELGKPKFNAHAHVMCDRTDDKGKVKKLTSTVLREVQNMTAAVTTLQRGLDARTTGRKHIGHQNFRFDAEKNRVGLDGEKAKTAAYGKRLAANAVIAQAAREEQKKTQAQVMSKDMEMALLKEQYRLDREALKASGQATQAQYQNLKKTYDEMLKKAVLIERERNSLKTQVETMTQENQTLKAENAKLEADKARFSAMATAYQEHKAQGKDPALFVPDTEAQHHARMAQPLLDKAAAIRAQVASGEKSDVLLVSAVGHELAASKITRIAQETTKPQTLPTPLPTPQKSLRERLEASLRVVLGWITSRDGEFDPVDQWGEARSDHYGPVVEVHDMHAVQKTGRTKFTVHELSKLDAVPALDDTKTEIHYRSGVGQVKGKVVGQEPDHSKGSNGPGW